MRFNSILQLLCSLRLLEVAVKLGLDEDHPVQKLLDNLIPVRVVAVCNRLQLDGCLLVDLRLCRFIRALVLRRDDRDES